MSPDSAALWSPPPESPELAAGEVHVWRIELDRSPSTLSWLRSVLSEIEVARASRFHRPRDRDRFVVARGPLREILALYLGREPRRLVFTAGGSGKPALASEFASWELEFNLSHSGNLALLALAFRR